MMEPMSNQQIVRQQAEAPVVRERVVPIDHVRISATTAGTAQTIYTVPVKSAFRLQSLMISNISASDVTFSIYAVPPSGSAGDDNVLIKSAIIRANASDDLAQYLGKFYKPGYTLRVFVSSASNVAMDGYGAEVF